MKTFEISFTAQGYVKQTVEITDETWTASKLEKALNKGKVVTTIQEDGSIDITASGKSIGKILNVDNNLEYEDFDVTEDD